MPVKKITKAKYIVSLGGYMKNKTPSQFFKVEISHLDLIHYFCYFVMLLKCGTILEEKFRSHELPLLPSGLPL